MIRFVLQKLRAKKWMILSMLLGNLLLISIACANPIYTKAVLQKNLNTRLNTRMEEKGVYPAIVSLSMEMSKSGNGIEGQTSFVNAENTAKALPQALELPTKAVVTHYYIENVEMNSLEMRDDDKKDKRGLLGFISDLPEHSTVIAGEMFSSEPDKNGAYDVMVSEKALINLNLIVGETVELSNQLDDNGKPILVRICGVFTNAAEEDAYWVRSPSAYNNTLLMEESAFRKLFVNLGQEQRFSLRGNWHVVLDHTAMTGENAQRYLDVMTASAEQFDIKSGVKLNCSFTEILTKYVEDSKKVVVTLLVLQVPVFVLLAAFIFMVSRQMLEMEESEIAVLKSRGSSKRQLVSIYTLQSLLIAVVALALGIPLGLYLCQVLGSANAFLTFVSRSALPAQIDMETLLYGGAAALLGVLAMVLPVFRFASVTIVSQKRSRQRRNGAPWWQKSFLDVLLLLVSIYGLYSFNSQKEILYQKVLNGASLDPLLFISSSLFIIGAGLVSLRLLPLLVKLVYSLFKKWWSPALFASFLRVMRTKGSQGFIMVFLMFTVALGMFNASTARTINDNQEKNIVYTSGADLVVKETWETNTVGYTASGPAAAEQEEQEKTYREPDFDKYLQMDGVVSATKVLNDNNVTASISGGNVSGVRLMGINTKEFGETANLDPDLLPIHWNNYLNAISQNTYAVLLSENFKEYGFKLGDNIFYHNADNVNCTGVVYGFVPYWPGYSTVVNEKGSDGVYAEKPQYLIIAHLSQLQSAFGVTPYEVWIKTNGNTDFIYDYANEHALKFDKFVDASAETVKLKNDPILQGTNGILTVSFIVVLLLCTTGFLIYWILSIRSRALQMGIFRAMGMSMREIFTMLLNEQIWISGLSIGMGALIGSLASTLYVPLIQIAYAASDQSLPLKLIVSPDDNLRLFGIIGFVMVICLMILGMIISKLKISQALKLGED